MGIVYPWAAMDLDRAVRLFGSWVESEMDKAAEELRESRRGSKARPLMPSEIEKARDAAWQMCIKGEVGKTRASSEQVVRGRRALQALAKITGG